MKITTSFVNRTFWFIAVAAGALLGWWAWQAYVQDRPDKAFVRGNGRIEATEIRIATKLPGRIAEILVDEGDFVRAGQQVAFMQLDTLLAQRDEARAAVHQATTNVAAARAQVALRASDAIAAQALIALREAELDAAQRRLARSDSLSREGAASMQELDDDRARTHGAQAALEATRAQAEAAKAAISAAEAQLTGSQATVQAAKAAVARIEAELRDGELRSPRDGRVQFRVAQPGEVLGAGGQVLSIVDLSDVYMTFFLPSEVAGRVAMGTEVRLLLDVAPTLAIPAKVSFVASTAQFTPKTVETAAERQKLMFRVKAQIDPSLLRKYLEQVKTGLPGEAWIKLDEQTPWPGSWSTLVTE